MGGGEYFPFNSPGGDKWMASTHPYFIL